MPSINRATILALVLAASGCSAFVVPARPLPVHTRPAARQGAVSMDLPELSRPNFMRKIRGGFKAPVEPTSEPLTAPVAAPAPVTQLSAAVLSDAEPQLPEAVTTFMTRPLPDDSASVTAASAVIGAVLGFAVGGPLLALAGAALVSYSTTAQNDAGEAARGGGKWAIGFYNWVAKVNAKYTLVSKASRALVGVYNRIKKNVNDQALLDQAEANVGRALEVTTDVADKYDIPRKVGDALIKTGELSVLAVRGVINLNAKYQITSRLLSYIQDELIRPAQEKRSAPRQSSSSSSSSSSPSSNDNIIVTPVTLKPATA